MLCRAAFRSLRARGPPTSVQLASTAKWSRCFAKDGRPKQPRDCSIPLGASTLGKPGSRVDRAGKGIGAGDSRPARSTPTTNAPQEADFSQEQTEFGTGPASKNNTQPSINAARPGVSKLETTQSKDQRDYSKLQDEFQTSTASDTNTAPQSSSPSARDPADARGTEQIPPTSLPDLTQGIPSTLDSETAGTSSSARPEKPGLNLTEDPAQSTAGGKGGGDLPKTAYISSLERRRNRLANYMYVGLLFFSVAGSVYLGRNWETPEEESKHPEAPSGWGFGLFYNRARARLADVLDYYNEPAFRKLLPDVDPSFERPYTLILSLEDLLVHSEWSREHGWRMAKRPGLDYFLRYLSQYYELVIFTSVPFMIADPIIRKLDPYRMIVLWPLFREATLYKNGEYIKVIPGFQMP